MYAPCNARCIHYVTHYAAPLEAVDQAEEGGGRLITGDVLRHKVYIFMVGRYSYIYTSMHRVLIYVHLQQELLGADELDIHGYG